MSDLLENSYVRGVDGQVYTMGGPRKLSKEEKKRIFFAAISDGNNKEVEKLLEDPDVDPNGSVPVPVGVRCSGGDAKFWEWMSFKLHERIAAERTPKGKKYIPLTCETSWGRTYQLTPLMVAYLYGNQNIVDLLKSKGANSESTTVISYYVSEKGIAGKVWAATKLATKAAVFGAEAAEEKVYSEPWKPERFAFPSNSAKGGTKRRRGPKKVRRRNRATRRTPRKK